MSFALYLYLLFTLLATGGVVWIVHEHRGPRAAALAGVLTFSGFVALAVFVVLVVRSALAA